MGADSLDRLKLATALGEAIHLHRSGIDDDLLARFTLGDWIDICAASLARFDDEVTFATSGSTGQPKWFVHTLADLEAEIDVFAARFAGCRRVISAVPSHHIYGFLFGVLLPSRLGAPVVDVRTGSPARLAGLLAAGDLVVAHPAFWAAFARAVPVVPAGVRAVCSTAPLVPDVARAVLASGLESLVDVYGSSETAGIGRRTDPLAPYALFPYWRRGADDGELVRGRADGSQRAVRVPDLLEWVDAEHIRPIGRREGAVQVGGTNVFPEHIRNVIRAHPAVADAAVRLMRADEGDRLKAFIVPSDPETDPAELGRTLRRWIESRLAVPERPRSITFGSVLPRGPLGKSTDWPAVAADDAPGA